MSGVEEVISVGKVLWINATGSRLGGQLNKESSWIEEMMEREGEDVGVRINLGYVMLVCVDREVEGTNQGRQRTAYE